VDDPIFDGITPIQMSWYALMLIQDKEKDMERIISYLDYHASFTNYEGVKMAKEFRESQKEEVVKEAEEFIEQAKANDFRSNPLVQALKNLREANSNSSKEESKFNSINLNKLIKEDI
jgi:hypothetical protein